METSSLSALKLVEIPLMCNLCVAYRLFNFFQYIHDMLTILRMFLIVKSGGDASRCIWEWNIAKVVLLDCEDGVRI